MNRSIGRSSPTISKLIAPCGLLGLSVRLGQCLLACRDVSLLSAENTTTFQLHLFQQNCPGLSFGEYGSIFRLVS
jgi:hypothetical protein